MIERNSARLGPQDAPTTWLGANFWSRAGGPLMWRDYRAEVVDGELGTLREHGLNVTRSFFYWPDFMPEPDRVDEELCGHFRTFLDQHAAHGMGTIPTFIVGHMSGENWDPAWRQGRALYTDVWMVARQAWFAGEMVRRFKDHPAVVGWLVSNEMPIYGGAARTEEVSSWAQLVVDAVRAAGATQPVSLGDGAWGIEVTGDDNGFSVKYTAGLCDFLGPHVYRMEDDQVRQHHAAAWNCELAGTYGTPVVLEEFGVSSDFVSDAGAAHYYRHALHNSLLAGATGWIAWNNTDYDPLIHQDPYRHHAFELHFGLTTADGTPKPQLRELRAFHQVLEQVDFGRCHRAPSPVALVVPSYLDTGYPFTEKPDRSYLYQVLRQAYVSARLADSPPALLRESEGGVPAGAELYLLPSTKQLLSPSWYELAERAREGATVYVSYSPGAHGVQRGPWYANLNALFGVQHQLEYGLVNPIEDETVTLTFRRPFGDLATGDTLRFTTAGTENSRAFLPVLTDGAEVVAVDGHGRPALLEHRIGEGRVVFCTYPLEHMAASTPRVNPNDLVALYDALARHAGIDRPVTVPDERVSADLLAHQEGHRLLWLVSQAAEPVKVTPELAAGLSLHTLDGTPAGPSVTLEPWGVSVLRLQG